MTTTAKCTHHWIIETPHGPISKGRCKKCKTTRDFENSIHVRVNQISLAKETVDA